MRIRLYTGLGSGNAYKVDLMLRLLKIRYEAIEIQIARGEHKNPEFRSISPFGQIPVLVDDEHTITDSQAILCYLARTYGQEQAERWLPAAPIELAAVVRWLSVAANEIQNSLTMARAIKLLGWHVDYDRAVGKSYELLELMDKHLGDRDWLATDNVTIADIACYPYLLLAAEGGIDTRPYQSVVAWMRRVESIPNFWPMPRIPNLPEVPLVPPHATGI